MTQEQNLRWPLFRVFLWSLVVALAILNLILLGYGAEWTGFETSIITKETKHIEDEAAGKTEVAQDVQRRRTLWDWLGLLGVLAIPVGVFVAGLMFNRAQQRREETAANLRAQDEALQKYLDQMSELIVDEHLRKQPEDSDIRKLAQARTIAVLLELDKDHKRRPLKLVYELHLINRKEPLLNLTNAGLDHANLSELSLHNACLGHADLRATDLSGANLSGSDLSKADLRGADLSGTVLTDANLLPYDERYPAKLSIHNLKDKAAGLSDDELRLTKIKPNLIPTNLSNTNLENANLSGTILGSTDLRSARGLKQEQLEQAIGNQATRLPNDLMLPEAWKSKSIEEQIEIRNNQEE